MPKEKNGVRYILAIGIILLLLQFSKEIWGGILGFFQVFMPILEGCIIAYILNIIMSKIERLKFFRQASQWKAAVSLAKHSAVVWRYPTGYLFAVYDYFPRTQKGAYGGF